MIKTGPIGYALIAVLAGLMTAAAGPTAAHAQSLGFGRGNSDPIHIEANDGIEWQRTKQVYVARGDARASQGGVTVEADVLVAHYRSTESGSDEIYRIDADGNVRILSATEEATSDKAVYDVVKGILILTGKQVRLVTAQDTIIARDSLEYYEDKQLAVARGDALAIREGRRVRADTLMAHFINKKGKQRSSKMDRIEAIGNVHLSTATEIVTGNRGDYQLNAGLATVTGDVKITRGETQLNGNRAEVNLNTGQSRLLTEAAGPKKSGGRVRAIFKPAAPQKSDDGGKKQ
jgi:lipopolysaccharide export system protein LptA